MKTQVEQVIKNMERAQQAIINITLFSADDQNKAMYEAAYEWLESIGCKGEDQTLVTSTRQFWGFWKMEWYRLDVAFLNWSDYYDYTKMSLKEIKKVYNFYHNHQNELLQSSITQSGYHQAIKMMRS